ncbi:asparagine synthase-related protein [Sedimentimonas flavescens]|uniref:asparagine synthase (glutamine-hydrolyzing) n=1 Tax=Sedimentimonas flavescens TaxID=2851012 RepID=A0ABT2ZV82_9RHOB|nr:asparagine synthase-related protein [Sedimentimonas flavescens]MCV2877658.1 asparagine synthase-related protein [Sedimentimonas flavescens]
MSGLAAYISLNGSPADANKLDRTLSLMASRGPDGVHVAAAGTVVMGYCKLATTPEAVAEVQPLKHSETGCRLIADIRLDNRDELIGSLALQHVAKTLSDAELLLEAWLRWGEGCLGRMLGDFAFVLWDPRRQTLFCARDPIGVRQLIYTYLPGKFFACATSPRALSRLPGLDPPLNRDRLADALIDLEAADISSTFYKGLYRLPPAHFLKVNAHGMELRRYWELVQPPPLRLSSDHEYAEAFYEVLAAAVRHRLRAPSNGSVGAMLSGGMDSGAVCAVASNLLSATGERLKTFSAVGPDRETCVETRTIHEALTMPGIDAHLVDYSRPEEWISGVRGNLEQLEEPFDFHANLLRAVYLEGRRSGARIMLDGGGGDIVLDYGRMLERHFMTGRWKVLWRDTRQLNAYFGIRAFSRHDELFQVMRSALLPKWARQIRWRYGPSHSLSPHWAILDLFAHEVGLIDRLRQRRAASAAAPRGFLASRRFEILGLKPIVGRERYDRIAASCGLEARDPYTDLDLIRFCLSLPAEQLQSGGWTKLVQRRAMDGLLPDGVRWRLGKEHLGWLFTQEVWNAARGWDDARDRHRPFLESMVRPQTLRGNYSAADAAKGLKADRAFAASLAVFLSAEQMCRGD